MIGYKLNEGIPSSWTALRSKALTETVVRTNYVLQFGLLTATSTYNSSTVASVLNKE